MSRPLSHAGGDLADGLWPSAGLEQVAECPICGAAERMAIHQGLTDRAFRCAPGEWNLYSCGRCGSCYLDPRPTRQTIELAYRNYRTHAEIGEPAPTEVSAPLRRWSRALVNGYCNWYLGTRLEPAWRLGAWLALAVPPSRRGLLRHLPRIAGGGRVLDVGAGNGIYLSRVRAAGWQVAGVEPDPVALAIARRAGLDVRQGGIECFADEPEAFDFITMNHVIEHVHDPRAVLAQAMALLKPSGWLFLETPNVRSYGHRRFGRHWRGLEPPRHLVLFHWRSLEMLLREVGFARVKRLPRGNVYPAIAAKSRAMSLGADPEAGVRPSLRDRLTGAMLDLKAMLDCRGSEFITLMASKR
ncbi:MAG TPA: class I SAM-dependent methyltransferase [Steroidobacteraceae bacterium]|nr:class I SAM-dependent methyltransferase [Steroidobacteraceae bacterium]